VIGKPTTNKYNFQYDLTPNSDGGNITLYRGTTGTEGLDGSLYMTDNVTYAASYIKIGICNNYSQLESERFENRVFCRFDEMIDDIYKYISDGKYISMISFDLYCTSDIETIISVFLIFSKEMVEPEFHMSVNHNESLSFDI